MSHTPWSGSRSIRPWRTPTGVGAPPAIWPRLEQWVDVVHKTVYPFVTGVVADRWIAPRLQVRRGVTSH